MGIAVIDRRLFLIGGLAACGAPAEESGQATTGGPPVRSRAPSVPSGRVLSPETFGARGDGRTDDTAALQACIDRAPAGAVVRLRRGAVYRIDTNRNPSWNRFGGLRMRPRIVLDLNTAELKALPSAFPAGAVVQAPQVDGWSIVGPGRITGERDTHRGRGGEWGMGIAAFAGRGWTIGPGVEIADCWGDGIYLGPLAAPGRFCEDFLITGVRVSRCRRNGISVTAGRNGRMQGVRIEAIAGTSPEGGIDLEPDHREHPNRNLLISGGTIRDAGFGIYVTVANQDIRIEGMTIEGRNSGIIVGDDTSGLTIQNNPRIASTIGGAEGAAIRAVVARPPSVRTLTIRNNGLFGGGFFTLEFDGRGYQGVTISGNRIHASNRGTQGIGRLVDLAFTDNDCVIEGAAGRANDFFGHFAGVTRGRNVYRNATPHRMHLIVFGGRDLGGDRFVGPNLRPWIEN